MESHHKKSSTSPRRLCPIALTFQNVPRKTVFFQDFAKKFEKVLDNSGFFPYNSTR